MTPQPASRRTPGALSLPSSSDRADAAVAMGSMGIAALPALRRLIANKALDPFVRVGAASALASLGDARDATPILQTAVADKNLDPQVRVVAARVLGGLGDT